MDKRLDENLKGLNKNYTAPFLWLHNEDDSLILSEIQRMYESGIRAVCLESRTHEEFCREDWWSDIELIFKECKKLGMNVWILDDKHFPTGYANGIFLEKYKDLRPFFITEYHIDAAGPIKDGAAMADCYLKDKDDEIVCVAALRRINGTERFERVIDITSGLSDGMVYFDLPEGVWRIVFMIKTKGGRAQRHLGFCDMLNSKATDLFINEIYEPHYERFSEYFGNTFLGFFSDEPSFLNGSAQAFIIEPGMQLAHFPWKDDIKNAFKEPERFAGIWFDIDDISDKIRYEYMNLITEEYKKNFSDKVGKWCREHNVMYIGHIIEDNNMHAKTGRGGGHYFRALSGQDMSGIDVVLQQIMPGFTENTSIGFNNINMNEKFFNYYLGKLGASFAHIDPKKRGRAMCEIFGAYGWAEGTKIMKYLMDHMLVRGINYFVPHAFSPKPNDTDCPPNFYDSGNNPQYKFFKRNIDYLNRMSHMLSDGRHISTCAILYDAESHWQNPDGLPEKNAVLYCPESGRANPNYLPLERIAKELYDNLLDYDIIPTDYLDKIKDSSLNGEKYNVLIVPYNKYIPDAVLKKLNTADVKVITVSESDWKTEFENVKLGNLVDYMRENNYCDISADYDGIYLRYYHYTRDDAHIYLFVNEDKNNQIQTEIKFSKSDMSEYIEYDGFENKAYKKTSRNGKIKISIEPYNSLMIIDGAYVSSEAEEYREKIFGEEYEIKPEFKISLAEGNSDKFEFYKKTDELFNVTGRDERPHFSGHIKYETEVKLKKNDLMLDLGYIGEAAELYINENYVGSKQIPPYTFEVRRDIINNDDEPDKIKIIVSNHNGYSRRDDFSKYVMFEPSGLLKPIKIKYRA